MRPGSFGQFFYPPLGNILIDSLGWHQALVVFALSVLAVLPLSLPLATRELTPEERGPSPVSDQSIGEALSEAFRHPSYVLLVLGFFTCGFQLAFITAHLPAYLKDAGLSASIGGWTLALIGLANAVGSLYAGYLSARVSKRNTQARYWHTRRAVRAAHRLFARVPQAVTTPSRAALPSSCSTTKSR